MNSLAVHFSRGALLTNKVVEVVQKQIEKQEKFLDCTFCLFISENISPQLELLNANMSPKDSQLELTIPSDKLFTDAKPEQIKANAVNLLSSLTLAAVKYNLNVDIKVLNAKNASSEIADLPFNRSGLIYRFFRDYGLKADLLSVTLERNNKSENIVLITFSDKTNNKVH